MCRVIFQYTLGPNEESIDRTRFGILGNEPAWTTDGDLLVYLDDSTDQLVAYDLETNTRLSLPFVTRIDDGYIVRRMRLACGVLVIEWCEGEPLTTRRHFLFRHYVLAFDVIRRSQGTLSSSPSIQFPWDITIRSEWRIHSPGLRAQIDGDVFYSAHTSNHYALYLWQNITSDIDPRDPLESLTIWDISKPSSYRASLDPTEANKPKPGSSQEGPTIINKFSREDLSFLNLQQRELRLREILIDDANVYFHEEDHRWLEHNPSLRQHEVRCTGFPFLGMGPRWVDECCAADGNAPMSFCPRAGSLSRDLGNRPLGFDSSRSRAWPGWAPCWRHEEFPYLTVSHMVDYDAGVRVVARKCFMMEVLSSFALPKITVEEERNGGSEVEVQKDCRFEDGIWKELFKGEKIMGDERWLIGEDTESRITIWRF
ncbi:hypothetical protein F4805DRAFT_79090 [Annulohypoxylon moriforme]|nr:hypothetical protein F4805DRAFT_79090 [Annulohypoxylon moriforme]